MNEAYRTNAGASATPPDAPLPALAEIGAARAITLSSRAGPLRDLFDRLGAVAGDELLRGISMTTSLLSGAAVVFAVAIVSGVLRLQTRGNLNVQFGACLVAGLVYGIVRVATANIRFVDKRTRQDVTWVMPLSFGFGVAFLGFCAEALLALVPIPSIVLAVVAAATTGALWYRRRPPKVGVFERVPNLGVSRSLLHMADPNAPALVEWNPDAQRNGSPTYQAHVVLADATRISCVTFGPPQAEGLEVVVEFPAGFQWRHPQARMLMDGLTLELLGEATTGPRVRATNTHAAVTPKLMIHALSIGKHACAPNR